MKKLQKDRGTHNAADFFAQAQWRVGEEGWNKISLYTTVCLIPLKKIVLDVEGEKYTVQEGDVFYLCSGTKISLKGENIRLSLCVVLSHQSWSQNLYCPSHDADCYLQTVTQFLRTDREEKLYRAEGKTIWEILFFECWPQTELFFSKEVEFLKKILKTMILNRDKMITLDFLAQHLSCRPHRITYLFYKFFRQSPMLLFSKIKMFYAQSLLLEGVPVLEIGEYLGYRDPYYFNRIYKKILKNTPGSFIKDLKFNKSLKI